MAKSAASAVGSIDRERARGSSVFIARYPTHVRQCRKLPTIVRDYPL